MTQTFPLAHWRLIHTPASRGAWNMAVDDALLEAVMRGESLPVLRLYSWDPPCLSLGYAQPLADANLPALQQHGWDVVRRPTGGRAILHTDEITYSVIATLEEPRVAGGVLESYCRLSEALLDALRRLGLDARADRQYNLPAGSQPNAAVCFEVPSNYEITVQGKKLVGSAQARKRSGVLQHGSLPLRGDLTRITRALRYHNELSRQRAAERLLEHAATVEMLGLDVSLEECAHAFEQAFASVLNIHFTPGELKADELTRAAELVEQKYAHASWTSHIP